MPELILKNISKRYGSNQVLEDINLHIQDGEFCVIVGPSGSGKTTLLNIIAGFIKPDNGEIIMGGKIINQLPSKDRNIGMVFQEYGLFSHMTVRKNISFGLEIKKYNKSDIDKLVSEIAVKLKIKDFLDKKPGTLSGGEAQRVAIGRTLITDPLFFLFDEPLGNLDANLRMEMLTEIKRLHINLNKTFIYVTHDQEQALSVASMVIIMKEGKVLQKGHPREVYKNPINAFIAEFFGTQSMNLIEGTITTLDHSSVFNGEGLTINLKGYCHLYKKDKVILGIRPEDIIIEEHNIGDGLGIVNSLEFLGDKNQIYLTLKKEKSIVVITSPKLKFGLGEKVKIKLKEDKIFLFDKENRERIYP